MKKKKFRYFTNLLSSQPMKEVKINHKNIFKQLVCKHNFIYLVKIDAKTTFFNIKGDTIENICPKCGKSKGTMFWEYEGMGYK